MTLSIRAEMCWQGELTYAQKQESDMRKHYRNKPASKEQHPHLRSNYEILIIMQDKNGIKDTAQDGIITDTMHLLVQCPKTCQANKHIIRSMMVQNPSRSEVITG